MVESLGRSPGSALAGRARPYTPGRHGRPDRGGRRPRVLSICSGGFLLDAEFSPSAAVGAGQDGRGHHPGRRRQPHRQGQRPPGPQPRVATSETGTRHRTAERVARSHRRAGDRGLWRTVRSSPSTGRRASAAWRPWPGSSARANQALQTLERYRDRLDAVTNALSALEVEDLVTVQRRGRPCSSARKWCGGSPRRWRATVIELGTDGRLVRLQLEELLAGVEDERLPSSGDYLLRTPTATGSRPKSALSA